MSRDQKPGRMRIIAGGAKPSHPLRRAGDRVPAAEAGLAEAPAAAEAPPKSRAALWLSLLFLLCCLVGGVTVTLMIGAGA